MNLTDTFPIKKPPKEFDPYLDAAGKCFARFGWNLRAAYHVWADVETKLPLRFEVWTDTETKKKVHESTFTEITFLESLDLTNRWEPPSWLEFEREEVPADQLSTLSEKAGFGVWVPSHLPSGFELSTSTVVRLHANIPEEFLVMARQFLPDVSKRVEGSVARLDYTDGMAVLSVVEFSADSMFARIGRRFLKNVPKAAPGETVQARRFVEPTRKRAVYVMNIDGTVIVVAGTVSPDEMEQMIPTFKRR